MSNQTSQDPRISNDETICAPRIELQSNALGLLSTAALTAAYMGPALSIYALFGPMSDIVGQGIAFVMFIAMGLTLLSAISFGMLAREMPSAGGVYAWSRVGLGESIGLWIGITTVFYFAISLIFPVIIFGQFFNELIGQFNEIAHRQLPVNTFTWLIGACLMLIIAASIVYRGITVSSHLAATLLIIEVAVIFALATTMVIFAVRHGTFTLKPMSFSACKNGWHGIWLALPMALMCMVCDAAVPAAEETRNAKWTIPVAVILTCLIVGLWYVFGFTAFSSAQSARDAVGSSVQNDIAPMVKRVWGPMRILVSITAMTASLGAFIPIMIGSSRMLFAMGREHKLPGAFSRLHPRYRAPWHPLHVLFAFTILGTIPAVMKFGAEPVIDWWGFTLGWYIGIVYLAVNLVNIIYYARLAAGKFNVITNALIPGAAIVVQVVFIWETVIVGMWQNGTLGRSAQVYLLVASAMTLLYVLYVRKRSARGVKGFDRIAVAGGAD